MKIAILGGAGARTPSIVREMILRQEVLGLSALALMDIDTGQMEIIQELVHTIYTAQGGKFTISWTTNAREALQDARYVITTFRVGGIASRIVDERTALKFGVIGQETTGPGGFALAMRTIPVLFEYIEMMKEVCPEAFLVNFANPSGLLVESVYRIAKWDRAVGICDAPANMQRVARGLVGSSSDPVFLDYFGLNHLGWVRSVISDGKDYLPGFLEMIRELGAFPEIPFDTDLLNSLEMIPNEYLYYYYYPEESLDQMKRAKQTRGEQIADFNQALFAELNRLRKGANKQDLVDCYFSYLNQRVRTNIAGDRSDRSGPVLLEPSILEPMIGSGYAGVALDLIESLEGKSPGTMILNVRNQGSIVEMRDDDVVEIPVRVDRGCLEPYEVGPVPEHCLRLMRQVKEFERLTISAAVEGSLSKAIQALATHPLVGDETIARRLVLEYSEAHCGLFPELI